MVETVRATANCGELELELRSRPGQAARRARLQVSFTPLILRAPQVAGHGPGEREPVACVAVRVFALARTWKLADGTHLRDLAGHLPKPGLHWGQMQATKEKERVKRGMLLPVMAYVLLLRLYGKEVDPDQGFTIFRLKRRFCEEAWQEQLDRSEAKWRKKLDQLKAAA